MSTVKVYGAVPAEAETEILPSAELKQDNGEEVVDTDKNGMSSTEMTVSNSQAFTSESVKL